MNRRVMALGLGVVLVSSGCVGTMPGGEEGTVFGPRAGDSLIGIGGSYSVLKLDDRANTEIADADAALAVSHFFEDAHEFGVLASLTKTDIESGPLDVESTVYSIDPFYNFNLLSGDRTFFYIGPHGSIQIYDIGVEEDSSAGYGGHVGIRHFHSPSFALFVEPRYTRFRFDGEDADDFSILLGLQYRF